MAGNNIGSKNMHPQLVLSRCISFGSLTFILSLLVLGSCGTSKKPYVGEDYVNPTAVSLPSGAMTHKLY